jgi:putative ABC transport system permease protein
LRQSLEAIRSVPGVVGVTATDHPVLGGVMAMQGGLKIEGAIASNSATERTANSRNVAPGFFQLLGVPILRGRAFTDRDVRGAQRVAIVNENMARQYWGTLDVLGKRLSVSQNDKGQPQWCEVVGVVADTRDVLLRKTPAAEYYLPAYQVFTNNVQVLVRASGDPNLLAQSVSQAVWKVLPERPITKMMTMERIVSDTIGEPKLRVALLGTFAAIGLALALLGVYGVLAYAVARRTREIGIRLALGASPGNVLRMILRQGLLLAAIGVAIGAAVALALGRVLASELFDVKPTEALTFVGAAALMLAMAGAACYVPAARAMRTDPLTALRHE